MIQLLVLMKLEIGLSRIPGGIMMTLTRLKVRCRGCTCNINLLACTKTARVLETKWAGFSSAKSKNHRNMREVARRQNLKEGPPCHSVQSYFHELTSAAQ